MPHKFFYKFKQNALHGLKYLLLCFLIKSETLYAKCNVLPKQTILAIPAITVAPDAPNGILTRVSFTVDEQEIYARCDADGGHILYTINGQSVTLSSQDYPVYDETGQAFTGLKMRIIGWPVEHGNHDSFAATGKSQEITGQKPITIEFIKTGLLKPGARKIAAIRLGIEGDAHEKNQRVFIAQSGADFIVKPSCRLTYPQEIDLGKIASGALNPASPIVRDFAISVQCSGDARVALEMHNPHATSNGIVPNALGNAAQGVGIQILNQANNQPVVLNESSAFQDFKPGLSVQWAYRARLYRTQTHIKPGDVQTYLNLIVKYE